MEVILVVDIDYADGWASFSLDLNDSKKEISVSIRDFLLRARNEKRHIIFTVFPHRTTINGQEAQLSRNFLIEPSKSCSGRFRKIIDRGGCIGCDLITDDKLAGFLEHRHGSEFEPVFLKDEMDAFSNEHLAEFLKKIGATELIIFGCLTFECVKETAIGAVNAGFGVTLIKNLVYPPFSDHYYGGVEMWLNEVRGEIPEGSNITVQIK